MLVAVPVLSQQKFATCAACHGANGVSTQPLIPSLAAQPSFYVLAQLVLFRTGQRKSEVMEPMAKPLSNDDLRSLGEAIEKLPAPPPPTDKAEPERMKRGRAIVQREHCDSCHQPDFSGVENAPRLAHQREDYLLKALGDFKKGVRVGYGNAIMPEVAAALDEADIKDLAHYLSHFRQ